MNKRQKIYYKKKMKRDFGTCGTITKFNISVTEFYREIENMELKNHSEKKWIKISQF